jgi:magnesium-dependent phosphatase 1
MGRAKKPLLVFDCDYTLWPFDCGKEVQPPFKNYGGSYRIVDKDYNPANPYPEVISVFEYIYDHGIQFAIASRNPAADWIKQLLQKIKVRNTTVWDMIPVGCFHAYSSGLTKAKSLHFSRIAEATGVKYTDMIFFDDKIENINVAADTGVIGVLIERGGLTMEAFRLGYNYWLRRENDIKIEFSAIRKISPLSPLNPPNEVQASDPAP